MPSSRRRPRHTSYSTPNLPVAAAAARARAEQDASEAAVIIRLHRPDAEALYATLADWLPEPHNAAALSALVALGTQPCRQVTPVTSPRAATPGA